MYEYRAKIDRVVDGDTIDFIVDLGFYVNIKIRGRLIGVDTPERGHPDWAMAREKCISLLTSIATIDDEGLYVNIKTTKTEKYGRWLVYIDKVNDKLKSIWPNK